MKDLDQHLGKLFTDEEIQEMLDAANKAMSNAFNNATAPSVPNASSAGSTTGSMSHWASHWAVGGPPAPTPMPSCIMWTMQIGNYKPDFEPLTLVEKGEIRHQLITSLGTSRPHFIEEVIDYLNYHNQNSHSIFHVGTYTIPKTHRPVVAQSLYGTGAPGNLNVGNPVAASGAGGGAGGGSGAGTGLNGVAWHSIKVTPIMDVEPARAVDSKRSITNIDKDWCVKCNRRAEFIRMSLVCPQCKSQLGGC